MKTLGNIIWVVFGGLLWAACLLAAGVLYCITIIGISLGIQLFKMAGFVIWPFGKKITTYKTNTLSTILNIVWAIFIGWEFAIGFAITGLLYCITIIGIPFGKQYFKYAPSYSYLLERDLINNGEAD